MPAWLESRRLPSVIVATILFFFVALGVLSVKGRTVTADEAWHYRYGMNLLNGNTDRFDDSKMPVTALNASPRKLASHLPEGALSYSLSEFLTARSVSILLSAMIGLLVFHWSRSLYGFIPALFSLTLYVFDPNIIAHSQLATTDMYAWGTITLGFYCLWRFAHSRTWAWGLLCAATLGLSQVAKYTALALFPLFLLALVIFDAPAFLLAWRERRWQAGGQFAGRFLVYSLIAIVVSLAIINISFLFNRTFTRLGEYNFRSNLFQDMQTALPMLSSVPLPAPYPYIEGLDWVIERERTGNGYGRIYLLGVLHDPSGGGFPGYYFAASLFKVPVATQILVLAALGLYVADQNRRRRFRSNEMFLLLPTAFFTVYFNFFYNAQIGIRYFLVVFPFLYIFAGNLFTGWMRFRVWQKTVSLGLVTYMVVSVLSYFPYYLTYFNELVRDKTQTYKYLADSNIDWGQNRNELERYLALHPDAVYIDADPQVRDGTLVLRINKLVGILGDPNRYAWLRENFEPVDTLAYNYLIYEITPEQVAALCATTNYCDK